MRKRNKISKEDICEDYCFACKDGGDVRICDHKGCLKVYHPECVQKNDSFLHSKVRWACDRHSCFKCHKTVKYHCLCCPQAVCKHCLHVAEFVLVKGSDGFCNECLKLAILIEENLDVDSDGGRVDFKEQNTMEFLFKEYWEIIKEKQGLCADHVKTAKISMKGKNFKCDFDSQEIGTTEDSFSEADGESDYGDLKSGEECMPVGKRKRSKGMLGRTKRKVKAKKIEFTGWGSKSLLQFLISIGKDTTKQLSQKEVTTLVKNYCKDNNLFNPEKKKTVICDAMLQSLLGKKSISMTRIHNLLTVHFSDNLELTEDDETESSSEDEDDIFRGACKNPSKLISDRQPQKSQVVSSGQKKFYASIVAENIKLVYLKRSLVEELLKQPVTFDDKIVGSFVRVKSAQNDPKKTFHQLFLVKGKTTKNNEMNTEIFLQLFNMQTDVPVSKLSDEDLCEEECSDLHQRIKDGLLKMPTVVELEQKAKQLHEDRMKHWIARELSLLQKRIDQANEKGWRPQLEQYINKKELLEKPSVQIQLLNKVPKVIADVENFELISENGPAHEKQEHGGLSVAPPVSSQTLRTALANGALCYSKSRTDRAVSGKLGATLQNSASQDKEKHHDSPEAPRRASRTPGTSLANRNLSYIKGRPDPEGTEKLGGTLEKSASQDREKHHDLPEAPRRPSRTPGTFLANGALCYSKSRTEPAVTGKLGATLENFASQDKEKYHDLPEASRGPSQTSRTGFANRNLCYLKGRPDPAGTEKIGASLENSASQDKEKHHDLLDAPRRPSRTPRTSLANGTLCDSKGRPDPAGAEKLGATLENSASQDKEKRHDSSEAPRRPSRTPGTGLANGTLCDSKGRPDPAGAEKLGATLENSASQDKEKRHDSSEAPRRPSRTPGTGLANGTLCDSKGRPDPAGTEKLGATLENSASQDKEKRHDSSEAPRRPSRTPGTGLANGSSCYPKGLGDPAEVRGGNRQKEHRQHVHGIKNSSHGLFSLSCEQSSLDFSSQGQADVTSQKPHRFCSDSTGGRRSEPEGAQPKMKKKSIAADEVIELDDDDNANSTVADTGAALWYIVSRHGEVRGPFKMSLLKHWIDTSTFHLEFKVWRVGEREEQAIPLSDAIRQSFHCM